ncbi:hypothetical protein AB0E08_08000 [Streptomyces sp. NPDC048281]|uniref:hypothetical protein n=1 Tax=Streptomyces sp. NPDC048281 TaxID=3154715 RepID=UPI0034137B2D
MTSAATETTAIVRTFDFDKLGAELEKDPKLDLTDVLAKLATIPPADPAKPVKVATAVELFTDKLMGALEAMPKVFGKIRPPKTRRLLTAPELTALRDEKVQIDAAESALKKRKTEIHEMISVHLDVVAERQRKLDPETAPKNKDGHYMLASAGNPERVAVKEGEKHFTREKAKDKVEWDMDTLLALYENSEITRAELLSMTSQTRVIDSDKIKRLLTLKSKMHRTREIVDKISVVKYGALSIHLR